METDYIRKFIEIIAQLRSEQGCPWDKVQTHESIRPCLLEESAELLDAIEAKDDENMLEELGDVMMQVIFHSQIATEEGRFTIDDVAKHACEKLISRHPHVFEGKKVQDAQAAYQQWEAIKKTEKANQDRHSAVSGVPRHLPALQRAEKILKRSAKVGFVWPNSEMALEKVKEELVEVKEALITQSYEKIEEEIGDLLFATVGLARMENVYAEDILHRAVKKYDTRFRRMEEWLEHHHRPIEQATLEEMAQAWQEIKKDEK